MVPLPRRYCPLVVPPARALRAVWAVAAPVPPWAMARVPVVILLAARAGISVAARARKVGVPAAPAGAARTVPAVWLARVAVRVPVVVTGELVTVKMPGRSRPTLVTAPAVLSTQERVPLPLVRSTWPLVPSAAGRVKVRLAAGASGPLSAM